MQPAAIPHGNSTFGTDPAPDQKKSLRIYTRGPNGRDNVQEFSESSTIDGSPYVCQNGNWNVGGGETGQYTIMHAEYGTERNHLDVTRRLRELGSTDRTFRMGNSTFGIDPDPGQIKMLRIDTRDASRRPRMFEYRESSIIDGAQFAGWGGGNWGKRMKVNELSPDNSRLALCASRLPRFGWLSQEWQGTAIVRKPHPVIRGCLGRRFTWRPAILPESGAEPA